MKLLELIYDWLFGWARSLQSPLLLAIRLIWGIQFIIAGWPKINDISGTASFFASVGIPNAHMMAILVALIEVVGGSFLVLGLLSRLSAFLLVCVMIGAYAFGHPEALASWQAFLASGPFLYLYTSLIILAFGAGVFSIDHLIHRNKQK